MANLASGLSKKFKKRTARFAFFIWVGGNRLTDDVTRFAIGSVKLLSRERYPRYGLPGKDGGRG